LRIEGLLQDCSSEKLASLSLQRARDDSLQAARAKATFLATMGHELRTPLNGVLGMLSLLERENLSGDAQEFVQVATSSGNALFELINTILDYSRLEAGGLKPESTAFELRSLAEDALERVSEAARHKGLELVLRVERAAPSVIETDPARLRQILQSLLGNAVKFTRRGQVVLSIGREDSGGAVTLTVTDSGVGIAESAQGRIFEPFTQADEGTTREYGGVGLGLSLTRQLARLLGADITVESVQGQGASFTVRFPLTVIVNPAPATDAPGAGALAGRRLLLCEPNPAARDALAALLEAHGAQVLTVARLTEIEPAIAAAAAAPAPGIEALLVADAERGGLLELLSRVKKQAAVPVLLLSNTRRRIDADEFEGRVEGVIAKPVRKIPLLSSLQTVLKKTVTRAGAPAPNSPARASSGHKVLVVDDVTTNLTVASRMLTKLGLVVDLADSGFAAIDAVAATEYDLIFMDCRMPGMSGLEATEMIRTRYGERAGPRIIAMTANEGQADRDACFAAGMHDFLSKPLLMSELERVVEKWGSPGLRQAGVSQPATATAMANTFRAKIDEFLGIMSADDLRQIVRRYRTDGAKRVRALETLLAGGEIAGLAADTHALKGSSSNLGFSVIVELCVRLEAQIQTLDQAGLVSTLGELSGAFETQCQRMLDAVEAATFS
jgi:CheY-like chemotaxis protein/nitrogen-specific signal transduction histidine kinase